MVNLWGPGAFGAARPAAVRPSFTPSNGPGDSDDWAKDCSSPTERDGTEWRSALLNELISQLRGVVRSSSVSASNLNALLLAQAIASGAPNYVVATGSANAWTLAPALAVPAYAAGRVLFVKAPATNTATTVNANVSTLGNRRIKKADGTDPAVGDLVSGTIYATIDDGTNVRVLTTLPSDMTALLAANKSPFNVQQATFASRTTLSGTGFVNFQTGSYTKKSATSDLIVSIKSNLFQGGAAQAGIMRVTIAAQTIDAVCLNGTASDNAPAANAEKKLSGLAAGSLSFAIAYGRTDGLSWTSIINPTSADSGGLPSQTTTSLLISEIEP